MSDLAANGWQQDLQRWWRISFQCSSTYIWVSIACYLVYLVFYMLSLSVMFKVPSMESYLLATLRGLMQGQLLLPEGPAPLPKMGADPSQPAGG